MSCSPARLAANRSNALKSTGPRTPEGKERSRANALKHGLCSSVVVPEDVELYQQRYNDWFMALKPQDEYHVWLVEKITVYSLRIDRAERMERRLRDRRSLGAELVWEDEARLAVERLGRKIGSRPSEVVEELRGSPAGCDWLISRWSMLAHAADVNQGRWTDDQAGLAFDLLGTPREFREGQKPGDLLDDEGDVSETGDDPAAFARREIGRLHERREQVSAMDEVDRRLTMADLFDEANPELKRLRRYESTMHNRLRWCLAELRRVPDHYKVPTDLLRFYPPVFQPAPSPEAVPPMAAPSAEAAPAPKAMTARQVARSRPSPHPPFDIEPHEVPRDGSKPDLMKILITRQEKRFAKAESRREARRRKLERLRA